MLGNDINIYFQPSNRIYLTQSCTNLTTNRDFQTIVSQNEFVQIIFGNTKEYTEFGNEILSELQIMKMYYFKRGYQEKPIKYLKQVTIYSQI